MAFSDMYRKQVDLLVRILPHVAEEDCYALKGGTAINLFVRNLERLSVDIDLTYLPLTDRNQSLKGIDESLKQIAKRIKMSDSSIQITESAPRTQNTINKLVVRTRERVQIKIEVTPVLRGCVYDPVRMQIAKKAEEEFGFAEMNVLSFADLYAGKIMAALDRQHPRDLFDIYHLIKNEGITDRLRTAFIIYLISHDHSPHSLLAPMLRDISQNFEQNFVGMTNDDVELDMLFEIRALLIEDVVKKMPSEHKQFLISFYRREPQWKLLGIDGLDTLPAIRWREVNLDKAGKETCDELINKLEDVIF